MKNITTILLIVFASVNAYSQYGEYKFFSLRAGVTHCLFNSQPDINPNKFVNSPIGELQLIPDTSYFSYVPGYFVNLIFNNDFKSDNAGIMIGLSYENFGLESKYHVAVGDRWMIDTYKVNRLSIPIMFKFGKKIYKKQNFFFIGGSYDRNLSLYKTELVSWDANLKTIQLDKSMLVKSNYSIIAGFNYMFFNFQADYILGSYLNRDYEISLPNGAITKPFKTHPKGIFVFKTSLNIPLNSWTMRKIYEIEVWIKKVFK